MLSEALLMKSIDKDYEIHKIAFLTNVAAATKKSGNRSIPVYRKFTEFYDYEKEIKRVKRKSRAEEAYYKGLKEHLDKYKK